VEAIARIVSTLQKAAADPQSRGPLVAFLRGDGTLELIVPPAEFVDATTLFLCGLRTGVTETAATAVGVTVPVRTLWGEDQPCHRLDAEAFVVAAAEEMGDGVTSVGIRCAVHELPSGWHEAHESLQWVARPLRHAVAAAPFSENETL
jgi:hypothetical protein